MFALLGRIRDFFFAFSGVEIRPHSQCNLGAFFPNFEKKFPFFKTKKTNIFPFCFLKIGISIQSTHTSYTVTYSFNLMAIARVIANLLLLLTKNDKIVLYIKFPNL